MPPIGPPLIIVPLITLQYILAPVLDLSNYLGTLSVLWLIPLAIIAAFHYEVKFEALIAYCLIWIVWYIR
jgi:hypothetical protein